MPEVGDMSTFAPGFAVHSTVVSGIYEGFLWRRR
jgi:hypothetical protein